MRIKRFAVVVALLLGWVMVSAGDADRKPAWRPLGRQPCDTRFPFDGLDRGPVIGDRDSAGASNIAALLGPEDSVWDMLLLFARECVDGYTAWMSDDFLFTSNDPAFVARFPRGMSRADEDSFATHLFEGGGHDASGNPLPAATRVILDADLDPSKTLVKGKEADVRIDWSRMQAMLSNGDTLHFGDTRLDFELRLEEAGWRVRRWVETVLPAGAVAQPIVSSGGGAASRIFLTLRARPQSKQGRLLFDLVLPKAGAVLEMFDVMGRRITRRDLSDLVPGRHTVALDGGSVPSGVYWARVRQNEATAVAKVVWVQ